MRVSFITGTLFSLLSECLCLPAALIWSGHTGGQSHNTLAEGLCFSPCEGQIAEDQLRSGVTCSPWHWQSWKTKKIVRRVTFSYTHTHEPKRVPFWAIIQEEVLVWLLVLMDVVSSISKLSLYLSLVQPQIPVSPWNCYWLSLQSRGGSSSINATGKHSLASAQAAVFSRLRGLHGL